MTNSMIRSTLFNGRAFMTSGVFFLASAVVIAIVSFVSISPALARSPQATEAFVEEVEIRGNRRIPRESVLYYVRSKPQDRFDLGLAQRDLQSIIQMGMFDPLSTSILKLWANILKLWAKAINRSSASSTLVAEPTRFPAQSVWTSTHAAPPT